MKDVLVMLNKSPNPVDTKFLLCQCFCKLMDMRGGEEAAVGSIERDLIDQNVFLLYGQCSMCVDARSTINPLEVVIKS